MNTLKSLEGKTSLVTGSSRGIGRGIVLKLAELGSNCVVNYAHDKSESSAEKVLAEVEKLGAGALLVKADVSKKNEVQALFKTALDKFGKIDILVNNAGIYASKPGTPSFELDEDDFDRVMDVNVKGVFLCTQEAVKQMIEKKIKGSIINTSSIAGLDISLAGAHYGASKAAVISLTKTWAVELGKYGINVNSVAPGPVETDLLENMPKGRLQQMKDATPMREFAEPKDIAEAVAFFALNRIVTGQTLVVDGGRIRH